MKERGRGKKQNKRMEIWQKLDVKVKRIHTRRDGNRYWWGGGGTGVRVRGASQQMDIRERETEMRKIEMH